MDEAGTWYGGRPQPRRLCVRWGPSPLPKRGRSPHPQFSAHFCCRQTAGCINMPLGMDVGLSPGDFLSDGDPVPLPKNGRSPQIFGPCSLWPNGWMDQDATWHEGRPQSRRLCVRWGASPLLPTKGLEHPPQFSAHFYYDKNCWMHQDATCYGSRPPPRGLCVRWGPSPPLPKKEAEPPIFGPCILWPNG